MPKIVTSKIFFLILDLQMAIEFTIYYQEAEKSYLESEKTIEILLVSLFNPNNFLFWTHPREFLGIAHIESV